MLPIAFIAFISWNNEIGEDIIQSIEREGKSFFSHGSNELMG